MSQCEFLESKLKRIVKVLFMILKKEFEVPEATSTRTDLMKVNLTLCDCDLWFQDSFICFEVNIVIFKHVECHL